MKKGIWLFICMLELVVTCISQNNESTTIKKDSINKSKQNDTAKLFTVILVPPTFKGGAEGWRDYLQANLNTEIGTKYVKIPRGQKQVRQTAIVSFIIDTLGRTSQITLENLSEIHPKLAAESIRVIKDGPLWIPATQNGKKVIYRHIQNITWLISKE